MLRRLLGSEPAVAFISGLASRYIRLVYATSTIKRDPADTDAKLFDQHPQILAIWHGQFMLLPNLKPKRPAEVKAIESIRLCPIRNCRSFSLTLSALLSLLAFYYGLSSQTAAGTLAVDFH